MCIFPPLQSSNGGFDAALAQHFLLSKEARNLSIKRITRLTEEQAFDLYVTIRFANNGGKPECIRCGAQNPYFIKTRRKWKCSNRTCQRHFSATTYTPFASRKLAFGDILIAMAMFAKEPKGLSALRLSHRLEVWYKTAFVLLHKIREQLGIEQHRHTLKGMVEIDGGYNGGYIRPFNHRSERVDRRRFRYSEERKCVVVMRERWGRSRAFICSEEEAVEFVPSVVERGSTIVTDHNPVYNKLRGRYVVLPVNHDKQYADGKASTNWAESYFSRVDRSEKGIHHHFAGDYLNAYADEMTWREDNRRKPDQENFDALAHLMTHGGVSRMWKGYWQRRKVAA